MNRFLNISIVAAVTLASSFSWAWRTRASSDTGLVQCNVFFKYDNGTVDRFKMKVRLADYGEKSYPERLQTLTGEASASLPSDDNRGLWINAGSDGHTLRLSVVQECKNKENSGYHSCSGDDLYSFKLNERGETVQTLIKDVINSGGFGVESCRAIHYSVQNSNR